MSIKQTFDQNTPFNRTHYTSNNRRQQRNNKKSQENTKERVGNKAEEAEQGLYFLGTQPSGATPESL